ncbi:hypothetical protein CEXT_462101 [Caerostris extrusa]|uniref:Uncharacterized protein n=1 Tax=Caerostris extrusa TaxID=172846 RepID=A0AAV4P6W3_CAEEX|nr:hypothetical protein CEXT_462101 [Caerostris extrusa]
MGTIHVVDTRHANSTTHRAPNDSDNRPLVDDNDNLFDIIIYNGRWPYWTIVDRSVVFHFYRPPPLCHPLPASSLFCAVVVHSSFCPKKPSPCPIEKEENRKVRLLCV